MSQTSYNINTVAGFAGMLFDVNNFTTRSYRALEPIPFGLGLAQGQAKASDCRLPMANICTLTASVDYVASNSTVGTVNVTTLVAGVRTLTSTVLTANVYATSHAATIAAQAVLIAAVSGIKSAVATGDVIVVTANNDVQVTLSGFVTTLGSGQPTYTYASTTNDVLLGISQFKQPVENSLNTSTATAYPTYSAVDVVRRGYIYVNAEQTTGPASSIYWRYVDGGAGKPIGGFRIDADTSKAVQVTREFWPDAITAGKVGALEINLP